MLAPTAVVVAAGKPDPSNLVSRAASPQRQPLRVPLVFEANDGRIDARVKAVARAGACSFFLTADGATIARANDRVRLSFLGAGADRSVVPVDRLSGVANYLVGQDRTRWRIGVATYRAVRYRELYPGIDSLFYGTGDGLEYDLIVQPGADVTRIRLSLDGARRLATTASGDLRAETSAGELVLRKPTIYQRSDAGAVRSVAGRYRVRGRSIAFDIADYDRTRPLVIDPEIVYSTYLGGSAREGLGTLGAKTIAVDASGAAYLTGTTDSFDFPTTAGTYQPFKAAEKTSVFVTKIAPDGRSLVYSTYIGGTRTDLPAQQDFGSAIAIDAAGDAYVTGYAASVDFPASQGFAPSRGGNLFLLKLDPSGSALIYSILFGLGDSGATSVAVDAAGDAYVAGFTNNDRDGFPISSGAYQTTCRCGTSVNGNTHDAFVVKFNSTATSLVYGTYIGGSGDDRASGLGVNAAGEAYVAGKTASTDFPTVNALQPTAGADVGNVRGGADAFVTKLSGDGTAAVFSTYLGGGDPETSGGIAVDAAGSAYVTGATMSPTFPATAGSFQPAVPPNSGFAWPMAYVTKLTAAGALGYSTFLGGGGGDAGDAIAVDGVGRAYVGGHTDSTNFPAVDATQPQLAGATDAFVTVLSPAGSLLEFSTYLGGPLGSESVNGIAVASNGSVYVSGLMETGQDSFPATADAVQPHFGGGPTDAFVTRIRIRDTTPPVLDSVADVIAEATSPAGAAVTFSLPAATDDTDPAPTVSADRPSGSTFPLGVTTVTVTATDASGNASSTTFTVTVTDTRPPVVTTSGNVTVAPTSAAGAPASFTASATDAVDGSLPVSCTPASGSLFAIGITVVTCTATDAHHNSGSATLTVTVLTAEQVIDQIIAQVVALGFRPSLNLLAVLLTNIDAGNIAPSCDRLGVFINEVRGQVGKSLTTNEAAWLILVTSAVRTGIGCR